MDWYVLVRPGIKLRCIGIDWYLLVCTWYYVPKWYVLGHGLVCVGVLVSVM